MTDNCSRCKGTGFHTKAVVHLGVPGLCYGCDGHGTRAAQLAKRAAEKANAERLAVELVAFKAKTLNDEKIKALAAYDAHEMGFIGLRKRDRRINDAINECLKLGFTKEDFASYRVTDEVEVMLEIDRYRQRAA